MKNFPIRVHWAPHLLRMMPSLSNVYKALTRLRIAAYDRLSARSSSPTLRWVFSAPLAILRMMERLVDALAQQHAENEPHPSGRPGATLIPWSNQHRPISRARAIAPECRRQERMVLALAVGPDCELFGPSRHERALLLNPPISSFSQLPIELIQSNPAEVLRCRVANPLTEAMAALADGLHPVLLTRA
jgi:hypothetical protein